MHCQQETKASISLLTKNATLLIKWKSVPDFSECCPFLAWCDLPPLSPPPQLTHHNRHPISLLTQCYYSPSCTQVVKIITNKSHISRSKKKRNKLWNTCVYSPRRQIPLHSVWCHYALVLYLLIAYDLHYQVPKNLTRRKSSCVDSEYQMLSVLRRKFYFKTMRDLASWHQVCIIISSLPMN